MNESNELVVKVKNLGSHHMFIRRAGSSVCRLVSGDAISHQLVIGDNVLLLTHYDYFDGVHNWLYLLNQKLSILDSYHLPDSFGFVRKPDMDEEGRVIIQMDDPSRHYAVRVFDTPKYLFAFQDIYRRPPWCWFRRRYLKVS